MGHTDKQGVGPWVLICRANDVQDQWVAGLKSNSRLSMVVADTQVPVPRKAFAVTILTDNGPFY